MSANNSANGKKSGGFAPATIYFDLVVDFVVVSPGLPLSEPLSCIWSPGVYSETPAAFANAAAKTRPSSLPDVRWTFSSAAPVTDLGRVCRNSHNHPLGLRPAEFCDATALPNSWKLYQRS